uniref:Uncharacterized protein n=1 Tax=Ananas comosus var. bracteatus TaxID=296719 RepID=A0A6V7QSC4_ANACO
MERKGEEPAVEDIAELMNDWFFGIVNTKRLANENTKRVANDVMIENNEKEKRSGSRRSSASALTQEWLEEAKKMQVELGSPSRMGSPAGSPRFASSQGGEASPLLDRRDPLSRSARRRRAPEGISDEILQRSSARHSRNNSECFSAAATVADHNSPADLLPPKPRRTSRFRNDVEAEHVLLSPPRNLLDSSVSTKSHRRSVSSSTCSLERSTSSLVAAICYAWLLANSEKGEGGGSSGQVVAPVVNVKRERMLKNRQAAWLLYHVGVDASALLFADEVDLEGLIMARQVNILIVGEDVLKTNGEAGSPCTVLTDNYCEEAYNLLQMMEDHTDSLFLEVLRDYMKPNNDYNDGSRESQDPKLPMKNSTSAPNQQAKTSSSDMQKPKQSPASAEVATATAPKAPETASRGKNIFFLAKWFEGDKGLRLICMQHKME